MKYLSHWTIREITLPPTPALFALTDLTLIPGVSSSTFLFLFFFFLTSLRPVFQGQGTALQSRRGPLGPSGTWNPLSFGSLSPFRLLATPWTVAFLCPWDSPGKNTGVGCHFLLQGVHPLLKVLPGKAACWYLIACFMNTVFGGEEVALLLSCGLVACAHTLFHFGELYVLQANRVWS